MFMIVWTGWNIINKWRWICSIIRFLPTMNSPNRTTVASMQMAFWLIVKIDSNSKKYIISIWAGYELDLCLLVGFRRDHEW